ncbi:putative tricarboxylic transport membrane protein [Lipingzhangella halophila]|uniref:Putative tricarboxylic transport membrane protein n=1 Tax=Lipingzhangella halophila TaxID=1783352 RepID=A0A7W7W688_9ACTN|nr:tripartite tricarboxylate transporter permease [Lipingzhangella halophila]MBB4935491.1 putative tricarboxylic transport membrane protein [Lipingzhangella halophila]
MNDWLIGLDAVLSVGALSMIALGVAIGLVCGALPGLTATMAVALLLPVTFSLDPLPGMMLLVGVYGGTLYAGSIPAILLRAPGTPSAAATVIDGYPMSRQGKAGQALTVSLVASVVGGLVGTVLLALFAPQLASVALVFGPPEYFMVAVLALAVIASISAGKLSSGLLSGMLGVAIGVVGMDPIEGFPRFTFGTTELTAGIPFIAVLIGLFGISEAFTQIAGTEQGGRAEPPPVGRFTLGPRWLRRLGPATGGSSLMGFFIGLLPGTGGDVASYFAYNETRRWSRRSGFGKGEPSGVAAAESANNASTSGALAPTLVLGIPGDSVTAILIGALTVHGLQPGPQLFEGSPDLIYGTMLGLILTYLAILPLGLLGIRLWPMLKATPTALLWPAVIMVSLVGAFALRLSLVDVGIALAAGALGFALTRGGYPLAPMVIGLILGPMAESNLRLSLIISGGSLDWLARPIPIAILLLIAVAVVATKLATRRAAQRPEPAPVGEER